jgi:pimeloyl-ACP methyl ester carboxylesterase
VELNPFTRVPKTDCGAVLRVKGYRSGGILLLGRVKTFKSLPAWLRYLDLAYPTKPADWADYTAALRAKLTEPERMAQFVLTMDTNGADAQAALPNVRCPALIVMGFADLDFPNPRAEGEAIVAALPPGLGTLRMLDGVGHYPHAECPDDTAALITSFMGEHVNA